MKRRSSVPLVGALIVSIAGAGVTRSLVLNQRERLDLERHTTNNATADLSKVNSFALGLLLGGLRGPLVMALWTSSETQKSDRDLEDFDTKVELIRLLQPEFDTVHLFQIWNKAYNISVQMANVPNKYTTILDALQYAFAVDKERPDNINILAAIGGLYFDKFGGASERQYFSARLQSETLAPENRVRIEFPVDKREAVVREARLAGAATFQLATFEANEQGTRLYLSLPKPAADVVRQRIGDTDVKYDERPVSAADRRDAAGRPTQHVPLLDAKHNLLPQFYKTNSTATTQAYDEAGGGELPYLTEFQPFPYGVSPYALAYNYYKRSDWLQINRGARHAQLSDRVIASRPGMSLEKWTEEEWYAAMRAEIDLANRPQPSEESELSTVTPDIVLNDALPAGPLFDQTVFRFANASKLALRAAAEYELHLKAYRDDELTYRSHIYDLTARSHLTKGDSLYLQTMQATGDTRRELAKQASTEYELAANQYTRYLFRYFTDDEDAKKALPRDVRNLRRESVEDPSLVRDDELPAALTKLRALHVASNYQLANSVDFKEIDAYILRAYARLRNLALVQ